MTLVAGADAGGTKTTAAVARDGKELARVTGPGAAVRPGRAMSAGATIARVVRSALNQSGHLRADVCVVGAAGVGREEERTALRDALRVEDLAHRLLVTTDLELALAAGFPDSPGIVLLGGTGSVAVARLPDGRVERRGGHGWQLGDEGGGYALGRAALAAVSRAEDGRGPPSALREGLLRATRSSNFNELVRWAADADPAEVAGLATAVAAIAAGDDPVAADLLLAATEALVSHLDPLLALFAGSEPVPLAVGGGLLSCEPYRNGVKDALTRRPRLRLIAAALDPVRGALALAARP